MSRNILLSGLGAFGAWWFYLQFFDQDMKMIHNEIHRERARRVHTHRLPFLDR